MISTPGPPPGLLPTSQCKCKCYIITWLLFGGTQHFRSHLLSNLLNASHTELIAFSQTCYTLSHLCAFAYTVPSSPNSLLMLSSSPPPHPIKITFMLHSPDQRPPPPRFCSWPIITIHFFPFVSQQTIFNLPWSYSFASLSPSPDCKLLESKFLSFSSLYAWHHMTQLLPHHWLIRIHFWINEPLNKFNNTKCRT